MPPRKKPVVRTQIELCTDDEAGSGGDRQEAPTKQPGRSKATTGAAAEKRALSVARSRKKTANLSDDDMDPIEDDEMEDTVVVEPETGLRRKGGRRTTAKSEPARKDSSRKKAGKAVETGEEQMESEVPDPSEPKLAGRGRKKATGKEDVPVTSASEKKKRMIKKGRDTSGREMEIAETQFEIMEIDLSEHNVTEDEELEIAPTPTQVHQAGMRKVVIDKASASTGRGRGRPKKMDRFAAEEVYTEDDDDLAKSTKALGGRGKKNLANGSGEKGELFKDLEKAYQALRTRYNSLQEAKETETEQALKAFQRNMKEKDEERSRVIETLQSDLEAQQKAQEDFSAEAKVLKKKLTLKETKVQELSKNLQDQQNENKVMSTKLVQAQAQTRAQVQRNNAQVSGSAVKPGYRGPLGNPKTNTGVDDTWLARVKEDLYADLSGLIIINAKKEKNQNVFKCVQTGTNGLAVQFQLSVPNRQVKAKKTPATQVPADNEVVDEDEIIFTPLFEETRDDIIIQLLPVYLRDEISFQRDHMTKFYQKLNSLFMTASFERQPGGKSDDGEEEEGAEEEGAEEEGAEEEGDEEEGDEEEGDEEEEEEEE